jgi:hypothetical protein
VTKACRWNPGEIGEAFETPACPSGYLATRPCRVAVAAEGGPTEVELEVIPSAVVLPPQGEVQAMVVARNLVTDVLRNVQLSWFTDAGVDVVVRKPTVDELAPNSTLTWTLQLSQSGAELATGTVHLYLDYTWQTQELKGVTFGALNVKPRRPQAVEQIANVQVETALASLMEYRPGLVYLVVSNSADFPVTVIGIVPSGPDFVTFTPRYAGSSQRLSPRETLSYPIEVKATDAVQPGDHLLLFQVGFEWEEFGQTWRGSIIKSHPVQVGIIGESEILKLIGVPTLLVLPGFLTVITVGWLWRNWWPQKPALELDAKKPEFWALAILLSLFTALFVYPGVTKGLGHPRSYLEGYGLRDITWLWMGSILIPAIAYVLGAGGGRLAYRVGAWSVKCYRKWQARHRPTAQDTPVTILQKLYKQELGIIRERVKFDREGQTQRAFLLEPRVEEREAFWVGPAIVIEWLGQANEQCQRRVERQLGSNGNIALLAQVLEEGRQKRLLRVRWKGTEQFKRPCEVPSVDLQFLTPGFIIEQE